MSSDGLVRLIEYIRSQDDLRLSPVMRQVLVNRISFEPTDAERERARNQIMGRVAKAAV